MFKIDLLKVRARAFEKLTAHKKTKGRCHKTDSRVRAGLLIDAAADLTGAIFPARCDRKGKSCSVPHLKQI